MARKPKRVRAANSTFVADGAMDAPAAIDVLPLSVVRRNLSGILRRPRRIVITRSGVAVIVMRPIDSSDAASHITQRERP